MQNHIKPLTGLRGIAAFWVVALHGATYVDMSALFPTYLSNFVNKGWIGVDLFFVLSGFIISYVHQHEFVKADLGTVRRFLLLRLARIYPAHLVATLILVPIVFGGTVLSLYHIPAGAAEGYQWDRLWYSLTLTIGWGIEGSVGWNWPAWSVGAEWFAYLMFPFIAIGLNRFSHPLAQVMVAVLTMVLMYAAAFGLNEGEQYMPQGTFALLRVSSAFLIGCCVYNIQRAFDWLWHGDTVAKLMILLIVAQSCFAFPALWDGLFICWFAILISALSNANGVIGSLLGCKVMLYLGRVSYSVYLIHYTVLIVVNKSFEITLERWGVIEAGNLSYLILFYLVYGLGTLASGHLLFRLVEEPSRRYLRARWMRHDVKADRLTETDHMPQT